MKRPTLDKDLYLIGLLGLNQDWMSSRFKMGWRDFADVEIIALVSKHVSGALMIIGGFPIIGLAANWAIKDPIVSPMVHYAETVIVAGLRVKGSGRHALETRYHDA